MAGSSLLSNPIGTSGTQIKQSPKASQVVGEHFNHLVLEAAAHWRR